MAGRYADSVYDHDRPGAPDRPYVRSAGYDSNEERLVDQAMSAAMIPADVIRNTPPMQRPLFPPRYGYDRTPIGIMDVVQIDRRYPDSSAQFSGRSGGYSGSSTPSLGVW